MSETEKVTVNIPVVDLGRIDLLVEHGFHSSRTDFVKDAVRRALDEHRTELQQVMHRRFSTVGVQVLSRAILEKAVQTGATLDVRVLGMLVIPDDVPPDLAARAIRHLDVRGALRASPSVKQVLADRLA